MLQRHDTTHQFRELDPFAGCSTKELELVSQLRTTITVDKGTVLARQGHRCLEFVAIVHGVVEVMRDGKGIEHLGPRDHFGEIGIVRHVPNPATIVARTPMRLEVMSVPEFWSAYTVMPSMREHIDREIDRRITTWLGQPLAATDADRADGLTAAASIGYTMAS